MVDVYSNFNEVQDFNLRNFNRAVTAFNIQSDVGRAVAEEYLHQFSKTEKEAMAIMLKIVALIGVDNAKKQLFKKVEYVEH